MKKVTTYLRNSQRLAPILASAIFLTLMISACDSAGNDEPEPEPSACGGFGVICDVSGMAGEIGLSGDGGLATQARHYWPMDITVGPNSELFIADWNNHVIRKIDAAGTISRFIGVGNLGDDPTGPADQLNLNHPVGLTIGPDGHYYLSAWHNWKVKRIDKNTLQTTTPIGTTQGFLGDGGLASEAKMDLPNSTVFAPDGMIYVSDQGNQRIRSITPGGIISTLVGNGTKGFADGVGEEAMFNNPKGPDAYPGGKIVIDQDGLNLYMADTNNNRIRKINISTREVTTIAGTGAAGYAGDGGSAINAMLNDPTDLVLTHDNEIYFADSQNHAIRKIAADGTISTVAGTGVQGASPEGTTATEAMLNRPFGVDYDEANHTLYFTDTFNQMTRKIYLGHDE